MTRSGDRATTRDRVTTRDIRLISISGQGSISVDKNGVPIHDPVSLMEITAVRVDIGIGVSPMPAGGGGMVGGAHSERIDKGNFLNNFLFAILFGL